MSRRLQWQRRLRGTYQWEALDQKPDRWYLENEYRSLRNDVETWRSPHVNGYRERP